MKTTNEMVQEIKNNYIEHDILKIIKGLQVKKVKPVTNNSYKNDIANVFSAISDNKIRPVLSKCKVTAESIIGTDLEVTVIVKNSYNILSGIYTKQMMELKTYQEVYKDDFKDFPTIKSNKEGTLSTYNKIELEAALNKVVFCANKSDENLSLKVVRFNNDLIAATDSYRLVTENLKSNTEFSLPLESAKVLQKILKTSNVLSIELYDNEKDNRVEIYVGNTILISRKVDLAFAPVKRILESLDFDNSITIKANSAKLAEDMKKLYTISKNSPKSENSFIMDFDKKIFKAIGTDNKIEIPFEFEGKVNFDKISLNAKFFEEYLKTIDFSEVQMNFSGINSAVRVNSNYIMMPLKD